MFRDSAFSSRVPPHIRERYQEVQTSRTRNMAIARKCGVKIAMGTDVGTPGNHAGDNMQELEVMVNEAVDAYQHNAPFGAKGAGESATLCVSPAVANAIDDAVGVRLMELPLTPEAVLRALRSKAGAPLEDP